MPQATMPSLQQNPMRVALLTALLLGSAIVLSACVIAPPRVYEPARVEVAPPAPRVEVVPPPRVGYVWVPGFWAWDAPARRHVWVEGRWEAVRPQAHYVPPHWHADGPFWVF
ncbi:MAG: hypothetical protein GAK30_03153 [Paracidovorax wautersii]|uniref:YXWGXW repeat-containing protein n=1 Tax=Paracidovorax wautersii TaxID=1177982 RepID=A0A7V8FLP2_9BURK|nr:MAG: hypothetical protein GAK30_03153 [Paracidovorax wautersii]